jgi:hypothetical protein
VLRQRRPHALKYVLGALTVASSPSQPFDVMVILAEAQKCTVNEMIRLFDLRLW